MSNINQMANIEVNINGEAARDELEKLQASAVELRNKIVELNKRSKDTGEDLTKEIRATEREYAETQKTIRQLRNETTNLAEAMQKLDKLTPKELQKVIRRIYSELNSGHVKRGTAEWEQFTEALREAKAEAAKVKEEFQEAQSLSDSFAAWGQKWMGIVTTVDTALEAVSGLKSTMQESVQAYADMQEAMSQVAKYTGMSADEVEALNDKLKQMDTRTARERLNELAGDAGKLGITSQQAVLDFVDAADKINVALGEDLGEDAVKNIGKLAQMFGEDKKMGLRGAMLATGSAINEVAQNSSAAEAYLVEFTARVAGAAKQANISQADIIGFASVLDENMLRDETAATAFQNILIKMFQEPAKFAKLAGISVEEFSKTMKTDAKEGVMQFIEAMSKKGGLAELAPIFEQMKLDGQGAASVLAVMAGKVDDIRERQELANQAYADGTSIINEFNVQNNTVQAGLDKAKKQFNDIKVELGERLMPVMRQGISMTSTSLSVLNELLKFGLKYPGVILSVTTSIMVYTSWVQRSIIADKLKVFWTNKVIKTTKALWLTLSKNPVMAITLAVTALAVSLYDVCRNSKKVNKSAEAMLDIEKKASGQVAEHADRLKRLRDIAKDENATLEDRNRAIKLLNETVPNYNGYLDQTTGKYKENKKALDDFLTSLQTQYELEGAKDKLKDLGRQKAELNINKVRAEADIEEKKKRLANVRSTMQTGGGTMGASGNMSDALAVRELRRAESALKETEKAFEEIAKIEETINKKYGGNLKKDALTTDEDKRDITTGGGGSLVDDEDDKKKRERANKMLENERKLMLGLRMQYASGVIDYEQFTKQKEEIENESISKRLALYKVGDSEYKTLQEEKEKLDKERQKRMQAWTLDEIEQSRQDQLRELKKNYALSEISEQEYNERSEDIMLESLKKKKEYLRRWGSPEEANKAELEYQRKTAETKKEREVRFLEQLKELKKQYSQLSAEEQMRNELSILDELHRQGLIKEQEYQTLRAKIQAEGKKKAKEQSNSRTASILSDAGYKPTASTSTSTDLAGSVIGMGQWIAQQKQTEAAMAKIKNMEQAGVISHEEAAKAMEEIDNDRFSNFVAGAQAAYAMANALMNSAKDFMKASMDAEIAKIEERYDREVEAAGNNSAQIAKIEEKKKQEIAKTKNKYNKKAMAIEMAQAVASTAMAAIGAYSSAAQVPIVGYILAPIAAAAATAAGMLQIATIKKQHDAQSKGYASGGFTGKGKRHDVAGVVHAGEFVANADAVNNPNVYPLLSFIDQAQRNNTIGTLTAQDISRVVTAPTIATADASPTGTTVKIVESSETRATLERLNERLNEPIRAQVVIDGEDGFDRQYTRYKKLKNRA